MSDIRFKQFRDPATGEISETRVIYFDENGQDHNIPVEGMWMSQIYQDWLAAGGTVEPDLESLQDGQAAQWTAIKAERDRRTQTGGYYVASVDKWFHSDAQSRIQQIGLVMYGANMPAGLQWKTLDGSFVTMTPALAQAVFAAAGASDAALFAYGEQLNAEVLAATDPLSVDVLAGWPKIYGE
jgi:hypothetical protein